MTYVQTDSSSQRIGSWHLSLEEKKINRATGHEGETLHPPEIDGDAFTGRGDMFLVRDGALICPRD